MPRTDGDVQVVDSSAPQISLDSYRAMSVGLGDPPHEKERNWRPALQNAVATSTQSGATQSMLPHTAGDMLVVDFFAPETLLTSYRAMSAEQSSR